MFCANNLVDIIDIFFKLFFGVLTFKLWVEGEFVSPSLIATLVGNPVPRAARQTVENYEPFAG